MPKESSGTSSCIFGSTAGGFGLSSFFSSFGAAGGATDGGGAASGAVAAITGGGAKETGGAAGATGGGGPVTCVDAIGAAERGAGASDGGGAGGGEEMSVAALGASGAIDGETAGAETGAAAVGGGAADRTRGFDGAFEERFGSESPDGGANMPSGCVGGAGGAPAAGTGALDGRTDAGAAGSFELDRGGGGGFDATASFFGMSSRRWISVGSGSLAGDASGTSWSSGMSGSWGRSRFVDGGAGTSFESAWCWVVFVDSSRSSSAATTSGASRTSSQPAGAPRATRASRGTLPAMIPRASSSTLTGPT